MGFHRGPKIVTDGLVLYLDAANPKSYPGSGTTWYDLSGNGNNGTLVNGPTFGSANGGSIVFDGVNDYTYSTSNVSIGGNQSLEAFVKFNTLLSFLQGIITTHHYTQTSNFGINQVQNNRIGISIGYTDNTREFNSKYSNTVLTTGRYYHVVITYNQGDNVVKLYIDGNLDSTFTLSKTVKFTSVPIVLGRWDYNYNAFYLNASVAIGRYYNITLTDAEVLQNYNATKSRFNI